MFSCENSADRGDSRLGQNASIVLVAFFKLGGGQAGNVGGIRAAILDTIRFRRAAHERRNVVVRLSSGASW